MKTKSLFFVLLFLIPVAANAQQKELKVLFVRFLSGELPERLPTLYRIEDANGETARLMNHNPEDAEFCRRIALEVASDQ